MSETGTQIKFGNGKIFNIYAKLTKNGVRFYYFSRMQNRYFPISKNDINEYILLTNKNQTK
jgi:hypothetical protein